MISFLFLIHKIIDEIVKTNEIQMLNHIFVLFFLSA